jgi:hypothetical protein
LRLIQRTLQEVRPKPAAAVAARLKAAGFTDADIFLGGAAENKGNIVARLKRKWQKKTFITPCTP